jgi:hypothetical protein
LSRQKPKVEDLVFSTVGVARRDRVYVLAHPAEPDDLEEGDARSFVLLHNGTKWNVMPTELEVPILAIEREPLVVRAIAISGEVIRIAGREITRESVSTEPDGPARIGWLRSARAIGPCIFAVGIARQAYCHDAAGWRRIDHDVREQGVRPIGFESVDGTSERDVYTVGLGGEIFRYDGTRFERLESPTTQTLHDVRAAGPDHVFACGAGGVLLRGTGSRFTLVEHRATDANLYALEWFREHVYVASLTRIYRAEDDALVPVDLGIDALTTGSLHASDGVLWSCGARHLAWTADGIAWNEVSVSL